MGGRGSGVTRKRTTLPKRVRPGWLKRMDQRSRVARGLHDRLHQIGDDMGGADNMPALARSLTERFVHVEALVQQHEQAAREGKPFDTQAYLALLDRVVRIASTLGLERRARPVPNLHEYMAAKASTRPATDRITQGASTPPAPLDASPVGREGDTP